jgi:hypothetical protein
MRKFFAPASSRRSSASSSPGDCPWWQLVSSLRSDDGYRVIPTMCAACVVPRASRASAALQQIIGHRSSAGKSIPRASAPCRLAPTTNPCRRWTCGRCFRPTTTRPAILVTRSGKSFGGSCRSRRSAAARTGNDPGTESNRAGRDHFRRCCSGSRSARGIRADGDSRALSLAGSRVAAPAACIGSLPPVRRPSFALGRLLLAQAMLSTAGPTRTGPRPSEFAGSTELFSFSGVTAETSDNCKGRLRIRDSISCAPTTRTSSTSCTAPAGVVM